MSKLFLAMPTAGYAYAFVTLVIAFVAFANSFVTFAIAFVISAYFSQ
ncbi:MAG: hypothetical protein RMY64_15830 [Nostoc sp. DedQUE08]|nr:hypothetical protein [Nostoc sp. DedQUE08]MDZ8067067.1 hypothetical protein [Nostoc sp. DedQUE08]